MIMAMDNSSSPLHKNQFSIETLPNTFSSTFHNGFSPYNQATRTFTTNFTKSTKVEGPHPFSGKYSEQYLKDVLKPIGKNIRLISTGPGSYNMPVLTGKKKLLSNMKDIPSFSMAPKVDAKKKQIISKEHVQE